MEGPEPSGSDTPHRPASRRRLWIVGLVMVLVSVLGVGAVLLVTWPAERPGRPSPKPFDLTATRRGCCSVVLTWSEPPSPVDSFLVFRDGEFLQLDENDDRRYEDASARVRMAHRYVVVAGGDADGPRTDEERVRLPRPPLATARLDGDYRVRVKVVSVSNVIEPNVGDARVVRFEIRCSNASCTAARWRVPFEAEGPGTRGTLRRSGATYRGSFAVRGAIDCRQAPGVTPNVVTLTLRTTRGAALLSEWVVARFRGRLEVEAPADASCPSSSYAARITGRLGP